MRPRCLCSSALCVGILGTVLAGCATKQSVAVDVPQPRPAASLTILVEQLSSPDPSTREAAAWKLASGTQTDEVKTALKAVAQDEDPQVRYAAFWGLCRGSRSKAEPEVEVFGPDDSAPRPVRITRPQYPMDAFRKRVQGKVVLEILIGEEGDVVHAEVRRSVRGLDNAALAAVREWKFRPGKRSGRPVPMIALAPVDFRIF